MKNIFLLPTDKLSRLFKVSGELKLTRNFDFYNGSEYQNIYITSDEEIKEGDYVIEDIGGVVYGPIDRESIVENPKKIILTTDQDLIKDGVQAIDDKFLEWFVENPTCEEIKVNKLYYGALSGFADAGYKIIIPKEEPKQELPTYDESVQHILTAHKIPKELFGQEEPKQETLEEFPQETLEELAKDFYSDDDEMMLRIAFRRGYTECEERMYSEEDMKKAFNSSSLTSMLDVYDSFEEFIKQFKKK